MLGLGNLRTMLALPTLAVAFSAIGLGQVPTQFPSSVSTPTVQLYYGTKQVVRPAPASVQTSLPVYVVPAIAKIQTTERGSVQNAGPDLKFQASGVAENLQQTRDAIHNHWNAFVTRATNLLRATESSIAPSRPLTSLSLAPGAMPTLATTLMLPTTLPVLAPSKRPTPGPLPTFPDVTPLPSPVPVLEAQPKVRESISEMPANAPLPAILTLTQDRLISALGIAIGVAATLGFALVCVLFTRRPQKVTRFEIPAWAPVIATPTPLAISSVGLPKVPDSIARSLPDPGTMPEATGNPEPPRRTGDSRRLRNEDAVVQFILDQNLAVISAIGFSRSHEIGLIADFAAPVRIP